MRRGSRIAWCLTLESKTEPGGSCTSRTEAAPAPACMTFASTAADSCHDSLHALRYQHWIRDDEGVPSKCRENDPEGSCSRTSECHDESDALAGRRNSQGTRTTCLDPGPFQIHRPLERWAKRAGLSASLARSKDSASQAAFDPHPDLTWGCGHAHAGW